MSKLIAASVLLGALTGSAMVFSAGCVSQGIEESGSASFAATTDADADAAVLPKTGDIVISEVYGSGGLTGAAKKNDYIELFNKTSKPIPLEGLSLQTSTTATAPFSLVHELKGTIPANGYFLVKAETGGGGGTDLAAQDQTNEEFKLGAKDGKVALVAAIAPLNCGGSGALCAATKYLDLVGWGATSQTEGLTAVPALDDPKKAATRKDKGCTDTNQNAADFAVADADPQTSADSFTCPQPPKDAGPDTGGPKPPAPPNEDPDLGPESAFDAGFRPEAGPTAASGSGGDDCAVGNVGGPGGFSLFAPLAGLAIVSLAVGRRRKK